MTHFVMRSEAFACMIFFIFFFLKPNYYFLLVCRASAPLGYYEPYSSYMGKNVSSSTAIVNKRIKKEKIKNSNKHEIRHLLTTITIHIYSFSHIKNREIYLQELMQ